MGVSRITICHICRRKIDPSLKSPNLLMLTRDHIIPKCKGGTEDPANLLPAHWICNTTKGSRELTDSIRHQAAIYHDNYKKTGDIRDNGSTVLDRMKAMRQQQRKMYFKPTEAA